MYIGKSRILLAISILSKSRFDIENKHDFTKKKFLDQTKNQELKEFGKSILKKSRCHLSFYRMGAAGLEPAETEVDGFTVHCNCRYATPPKRNAGERN